MHFLKEFTAAFVGFDKILPFMFFFLLYKAFFFVINFLNMLCDVYSRGLQNMDRFR